MNPLNFSVLSTATTRTQRTAHCTARALESPQCLWTVRSGQLRAAAATWLTHSGTTRSLTAWLLLLHCCMTSVCMSMQVCICLSGAGSLNILCLLSFLCHPPSMSSDASNVSHLLTHPKPLIYMHTHCRYSEPYPKQG